MQNSNASQSESAWTVSKLIAWTKDYFKGKNIESPRLTAELLLCEVLQCSRVSLYINFDKPLLDSELSLYKSYIKRRINFEPVSYITNKKSFFDLDFYVDENVLIPRPDTETLIKTVCNYFQDKKQDSLKILDLGTGSGIIAVCLADYFSNSQVYAADTSFEALKTAEHNKKINKIENLSLVLSDWFSGFKPYECFDIIVSNPPYIKTADIENLQPEIKLYEPCKALDGGDDGLDCLRLIIKDASLYMKKDSFIIMEAGFDQKEGIKELVSRRADLFFEEMVKDFTDKDRVAVIRKK
ncbi:MAG: peptide chain release factor N(5)-glutamine methyltransferase [Thermodesulfobacteriota bacterium]